MGFGLVVLGVVVGVGIVVLGGFGLRLWRQVKALGRAVSASSTRVAVATTELEDAQRRGQSAVGAGHGVD